LLRPGALADAPRNGNRKRADRPRPHDLPAHPPRGHPRRHDLGVIAAVVLAAGAATRYGAPKQRELLPRVLARLAESPVDEVVVVAGAHPLESGRGRVVDCPAWEAGPGPSRRRRRLCRGTGPELVRREGERDRARGGRSLSRLPHARTHERDLLRRVAAAQRGRDDRRLPAALRRRPGSRGELLPRPPPPALA